MYTVQGMEACMIQLDLISHNHVLWNNSSPIFYMLVLSKMSSTHIDNMVISLLIPMKFKGRNANTPNTNTY